MVSKERDTGILDEKMLETLFRLHFKELSLFALKFVSDVDTAKEIVHQVFISLWERRESVDVSKSLNAFLFTSVRNRALNYLRDLKKTETNSESLEKAEQIISDDPAGEGQDTLQRKLYEAIEALPKRSRQVFELNRFENMTYREIAEKLDISQKTVETLMSRTLKTLREKLKDLLILLLVFLFFT